VVERSKPKVARGDAVKAGEGVVEADLAAIKAAGYATTKILVITNTAAQREVVAASVCCVTTPTRPRRHHLTTSSKLGESAI